MDVSVAISPSGPIIETPGSNFSLVCSATISPPPLYGAPLILGWFFGPENTSLPSGVAVANVTHNNNIINITYTSTLQFFLLQESHAGIYTCRIGHTAASTMIFAGSKLMS